MLKPVMNAVSGMTILNDTSLAFAAGLETRLVTRVFAYLEDTLLSMCIDFMIGFNSN